MIVTQLTLWEWSMTENVYDQLKTNWYILSLVDLLFEHLFVKIWQLN